MKETIDNKPEGVRKVLILGSGGLSIGQAGEFDYSGSQAIKALKEEGIKTVLVNPNIATIQTSWGFADEVYFLPITKDFVERIIEKEKPDGVLLGFGGQTALNCGIDLHGSGVLEKHGVKVLGTPVQAIITTEDKGMFAERLAEIRVKTPKAITVDNLKDGIKAAGEISFPVIVRAGYALGGLGSGICKSMKELKEVMQKALTYSKQILVEESLEGWKEVEYEVMRDRFDNCMTVCNMENFDPMGIHTGESIVIAPSQTLTDHEYQKLRSISIKVIRSIGIIGECNIQFALDPNSDDYRVIEVNARLSRSSALASKATGYPLAFIAAKLAIGHSLLQLPNPVTKTTKAFFEPALDYLVVKFPRWDHEKFRRVKKEIGSSMKSVGEVMAIGRKFEEALQKAVRMVNPGLIGLSGNDIPFESLDDELRHPTDKRVFAVVKALEQGYTVDRIHDLTMIDRWFLHKIKNIVEIERELRKNKLSQDATAINTSRLAQTSAGRAGSAGGQDDGGKMSQGPDRDLLRKAKSHGFSDRQIAKLTFGDDSFSSEMKVRHLRKEHGILPVIKRIDTLAAEYPCHTNYLYLTYNGNEDDITIEKKGIIVLGSGPYSIGSSVEFDWCCVECIKTLTKENIPPIVINCNPETVSTDYDESERLYFEELTVERVLDIHDKEDDKGVIVSMGGQIPNTLAFPLSKAGVDILGTDPKVIDSVEDRHKFSKILDQLGVDQPEWKESTNMEEIMRFCRKVGFPILIRPSYVLSGSAMNVAFEEGDVEELLKKAAVVSKEHPVVLTRFIDNAKEVDMDIVAFKGEIMAYAITEHIEKAGVHSGDATLVTPPQKLYLETVNKIKKISKLIVSHLNITGPLNIQFLAKENKIKIIECNLRASRSFPFVSKVYNVNFIRLATKGILGKDIARVSNQAFDLDYLGVKAPQFSFTRLKGADPQLGVEMASTGEVACLGETAEEAFLKALISTGFRLPKKTVLLSTGDIESKARLLESVKMLQEKGYVLYATKGTADFYKMHGVDMHVLAWPLEEKKPNVMDYLKEKRLDLVVNIPKSNEDIELSNDYLIRRAAADFDIPLITNAACTRLFVDAICSLQEKDLDVKSWKEYVS
ncbi:MAG: carbamoyl-phosphate synthase large subunit [Nanoarchaeota archaeon]|nr:carbamoyl-phosphate synthase large subunit [Nanoarchaeota archaeon]